MLANRLPAQDSAARTHAALVRLSRDAQDADALNALRDANRAVIRAAVKRWLGNQEYHQSAAEFAVMVHLAKTAATYRSDRQDPASWVAAAADGICRSLSLALANRPAPEGAEANGARHAKK